jgi:hypothetical protein
MPRGDKTGPEGLGSKTGRAAGYCAGYPVPGYMNSTRGYGRGFGRGYGRGFGRGFGRRRGRGFGRGRFVYRQPVVIQPSYQPVAQPLTPEQEIVGLENYQKDLEAEKVDLEQEMGGVKARIEELKAIPKQEK